MTPSLTGRVCVVTGATGGLGKATCRRFAEAGATLVMVARDRTRGEAARAEVLRAAPAAHVELELCDLSLRSSIREAAKRIVAAHPKIHVLVNDAAVYRRERVLTSEKLETMFATNYLGRFLLTNLLLPALKNGAPSRIITVSAPSTSPVELDNLQGEKRFSSLSQFGSVTAANLRFSFELARRLEGTGVTSNTVHPGLMRSDLMREAPAGLRFLLGIISRNPEKAATSILHLAAAPELATTTGRYFVLSREAKPPKGSDDVASYEPLWRASEGWAGLATTRVQPVPAR
jgi:NAD(P)-dependent dehydrogenase (short-subunit alcohol dehydrogenase family)